MPTSISSPSPPAVFPWDRPEDEEEEAENLVFVGEDVFGSRGVRGVMVVVVDEVVVVFVVGREEGSAEKEDDILYEVLVYSSQKKNLPLLFWLGYRIPSLSLFPF